jgi:hypothetical protein
VKGIAKWWSGTAASQRQRGGGSSPQRWGKFGRKEEASAGDSFYRRGREREGTIVVPHVCDGRPTAHWSDGDVAHVGFPCPGSLTVGPRSFFSSLV